MVQWMNAPKPKPEDIKPKDIKSKNNKSKDNKSKELQFANMVQICSTLGKVRDRSKEGRQSGLNWPPHRIETAAPVWATVCKDLQGLRIFAGANIGLCSFCHLKGATFFIPPSNIEGGAALRIQKCSLQLIKGGKCKILSIKGQLYPVQEAIESDIWEIKNDQHERMLDISKIEDEVAKISETVYSHHTTTSTTTTTSRPYPYILSYNNYDYDYGFRSYFRAMD